MPPATTPRGNKFLNSREWRSFLAAAQSAAATPSVISAVKASQAWLSGSAAKTYRWLLVNGSLVAGARKTLGS
jgi:hypothetical protein